jgi:hypothetical protein
MKVEMENKTENLVDTNISRIKFPPTEVRLIRRGKE